MENAKETFALKQPAPVVKQFQDQKDATAGNGEMMPDD
jgi:hypothetical protein